ncbi:MAG: MATE family efflux transporter, partial [Shewanella sp.]
NIVATNEIGHNVVLTEEDTANGVAQKLPSATHPLSSSCVQRAQLIEEQENQPILTVSYFDDDKKA